MVILQKITWKEFEKIIQILEKYQTNKTNSWYSKICATLKKVKKKNANMDISITKQDFKKIAIIFDNWNLIIENSAPTNPEVESIANKLKKAYYQNYNKKIYD